MTHSRGFAPLLILVIIAVALFSGGAVYIKQQMRPIWATTSTSTSSSTSVSISFISPGENDTIKEGSPYEGRFTPFNLSSGKEIELRMGRSSGGGDVTLDSIADGLKIDPASGTYKFTVNEDLWHFIKPVRDGEPAPVRLTLILGHYERDGGANELVPDQEIHSPSFYVLGETRSPSAVPHITGVNETNIVLTRGNSYTVYWLPINEFPSTVSSALTPVQGNPISLEQSITFDAQRVPQTIVTIPKGIPSGAYTLDFVDSKQQCSQLLGKDSSGQTAVVAKCPAKNYMHLPVTVN